LRVPPVAYEKVGTLKQTAQTILETISSCKEYLINFLLNDLFTAEDAISEKSVGLRILANLFCCEDDLTRLSTSSSTNGSELPVSIKLIPTAIGKKLTDLLFECIASEGKRFAGAIVEKKEDSSQLLEACAIDGILLCRVIFFSDSVTPLRWQELAWTLINVDMEIQRNLVNLLTQTIQIHPLPLKFLAFPCLFANHPVDMADQAKKALIFAVKRLRRTHEELNAQLVLEKDEKARERLKYYSQYTTPEMILPYLLYLLSYHPHFPSSMNVDNDEDCKRVQSMISCVRLLIGCLQLTLRNETSNLPFLFKQLNMILTKYVDKDDEENIGIHFIARLALETLTEQVKTSDNVQVYPGEIILPEELYRQTESGKALLMLNRVATESSNNDDAEHVMSKVIAATSQKSRKNFLSSPIRGKVGGVGVRASSKSPIDHGKEGKKSTKASKPEKTKKESIVNEDGPVRVLPKRGAKTTVTYTEMEEDDTEVEKWNEEAGKGTNKVVPKTISSSWKPSVSEDSKVATSSFSSSFVKPVPSKLTSLHNQVQNEVKEKKRPTTQSFLLADEDDFDIFNTSSQSSKLAETALSNKSLSSKRKLSNNSKLNFSQDVANLSRISNGSDHSFDLFEVGVLMSLMFSVYIPFSG
jgi:hypothetical protein